MILKMKIKRQMKNICYKNKDQKVQYFRIYAKVLQLCIIMIKRQIKKMNYLVSNKKLIQMRLFIRRKVFN